MMRLQTLHLSLFGHFTDKTIDFGPRGSGPDFHIVYGPNEAGKTTLMEGYLRLLYGFPGQDAYGFKHQRANLQVGATLEIAGKMHQLTRVSRRSGNLLDETGQPVPEALLQTPLAGLSMENYRALLCLDDETMETGGEAITNSKGDIGRLLFQASAAGDLSAVLDETQARTAEIYLKGGSKHAFAALKKAHEQVVHTIKTQDMSEKAYTDLRSNVAQAHEAEAAAREEKAEVALRKTRLEAIVAAHPMAVDLQAEKAALAPIEHYPSALDIDPETLVQMMTDRVRQAEARDRADTVLEALTAEQAEMTPRPDILALAPQLDALQGLHNRISAAAEDMPKRVGQRDRELETLRRLGAELGFEIGKDPARFILTEPQITDLERKNKALHAAIKEADIATIEVRAAEGEHLEAAQKLKQAQARATIGPALEATLARHQAEALLAQVTSATQEITQAAKRALGKRQNQSRLRVEFQSVPVLELTAAQAAKLAADMAKAHHAAESAGKLVLGAKARHSKAQVALTHMDALPDLVSDEAAAESRAARDASWQAHQAALEQATAKTFEAAMRADDRKTGMRQGQTKEIAERRQVALAVQLALADLQAAEAEHAAAADMAAGLAQKLAGHLAGVGLPNSLTATDFADWVRDVAEAQEAQNTLTAIELSHAATLKAGEALREELAQALADSGTLAALVEMAKTRVSQRAEQQRAVVDATDNAERSQVALFRRQNAVQACAASDAHSQWQAAIHAAFPDAADLRDALPNLRKMREVHLVVESALQRIDSMAQDQANFAAQLEALSAGFAFSATLPPLVAYQEMQQLIAEEQRVAARIEDLTQRLANAQAEREAASAEIATLDKQTQRLATVFDAGIKTDNLDDLRAAVSTGTHAIALRKTVSDASNNLLASLNVGSLDAALSLLETQALDAATAELSTLEGDIARAESALGQAIENRTKADMALHAVVGESDIAELMAKKRTLQAEMEAALLRYLEGRFGLMLAEGAIRRFREAHRSGMMAATEQAFTDLTNGRYTALRAHPGPKGEVLMATQAEDQSAKLVSGMSKGTRFQLYLALRAAAYEQMASSGTTLPFFCDDVFETFDETRTRAACRLMQRIGRTGQAIYLTHHQHVVDIAREVCAENVQLHRL